MKKEELEPVKQWIKWKEGLDGPDAVTTGIRKLLDRTDVRWRERWGNRAHIRREKNCPW